MEKVLVVNTGSSSLKFGLYLPSEDALLIKGRLEKLGTPEALFHIEKGGSREGAGMIAEEGYLRAKSIKEALRWVLDQLLQSGFLTTLSDVTAVGHRVVHGGEKYRTPVLVTKQVKADITAFARFAPLHNPPNLAGIEACEHLLRSTPQVAVFDTAFHHTMPEKAYLYGINKQFAERHGIRKYGFHGTNHKYCALTAKELLGRMPARMITCHLGNGSSVTAIKHGLSVDTSMGFTPTDGLIMGTRSGALDPEIVLYLLRELKANPSKINEYLNKESGLKSLAGSSDVRELWRRVRSGDAEARLALEMLAYHVLQYVGAYAAVLNGLDCLVFTGGIGENAWYLRSMVCEQLTHLGVKIDPEKNERNEHDVSTPDARVQTLIIKANEELQIGREVAALLKKEKA